MGLAVVSGGVASLYILLLLGPRTELPMQLAPLGGEWWFAIFAVGSALLGVLAAATFRNTASVIGGASAAALAIVILIAVKAALWPEFPAVSEGFRAIPVIFAVGGGTAAVLTLRVQRPGQIVVAVLASIAGTLAVTYFLGMFVGS